jgi:hypothetical protein
MFQKPNKFGGGAQTNKNGLYFEQTTSLNDSLKNAGFEIGSKNQVLHNNTIIGYSINKSSFSSKFLAKNGINYKDFNSKRWDPDEAFINIQNKTVYIIEKKFQKQAGSVDEKLATFPFKIYEYKKLLEPLSYKVVYIYLLSSKWFDSPKYKDYYDYMDSLGCPHYFDVLPLQAIGIDI